MKVSEINVKRLPPDLTAAEMAVMITSKELPEGSTYQDAAAAAGLTFDELEETLLSLQAKGYIEPI